MGQKIHPKVFRLNTIYDWDSKWFAKKDKYISSLREDVRLREYIKKQLKDAAVDSVIIDRNSDKVNITIISAKPGFVIGRSGAGIEDLKKKLQTKFYAGKNTSINLNVKEVHNPSLSAAVVGQQIANEVERRLPFRRSMKMALERIMKAGAKGAKIQIAGRLNGADIARTETVSQGSIPLHNLRADIDYAHVEANTIWGTIGVKTWIFRGEVFDKAEVKKTVVEKPKRRKRRN